MRDKRQNQKLSLLSDVFSEIRMNLNVDSEDAKEQQRVKDLIGQFIDWVTDISDCLNSDAWRGEESWVFFSMSSIDTRKNQKQVRFLHLNT